MFAILDDAGKYTSLHIWFRRSLEEFNSSQKPDFSIQNVNPKRVVLAIMQRNSMRILPVESPGGKGVWMFVAVEASEIELEAVRALSKTTKLTHKDARELIESPIPERILKHLSLRKILE